MVSCAVLVIVGAVLTLQTVGGNVELKVLERICREVNMDLPCGDLVGRSSYLYVVVGGTGGLVLTNFVFVFQLVN